jgi:hypothetical protein
MVINGLNYSLLAHGWRQLVWMEDTVSFDWDWDESKRYRNIKKETLVVRDGKGRAVVRPKPMRRR